MTENAPEQQPELDEDQQLYESLFGTVPEWHQSTPAPLDPETDDDLYRALFGA